MTTTTYYLAYPDDKAPADQPWGLYRRVYDDEGQIIASEAYNPKWGWIINDYWLRLTRGEPDMHLVEIDDIGALQTQQAFDALPRDD